MNNLILIGYGVFQAVLLATLAFTQPVVFTIATAVIAGGFWLAYRWTNGS